MANPIYTATTSLVRAVSALSGNGEVEVVLMKKMFADDKVLFQEPHLMTLPPSAHGTGYMRAQVDQHLSALGWPLLSDDDWGKINAVAEQLWTPEVIAAYKASQAMSVMPPEPAG